MPALAMVVLNQTLGLGMGDGAALVRHWRFRRAPEAVLWNRPEPEGELTDFLPLPGTRALVIREGGLAILEGGELRPLGPPQGLLRFDPTVGGTHVAGTFHRVLGWDGAGLRHLARVSGAARAIRGAGDRLAVAVEGARLDTGQVEILRSTLLGDFEPEGRPIPIGLSRWSGFELSPDGSRMLANLPGADGVGVWELASGRLLATWPAERLARVLAWADQDRVLFDYGPRFKGRNAVHAHSETRLVLAKVGSPEAPAPVVASFAQVLASASDGRRLAFADGEGVIRVVGLGSQPSLLDTLAPKDRGVPWRLRWEGPNLWVLLSRDTARLERYTLR